MLNIYKIKKILNINEKKNLKFVFLYSIINSIFEFISIGLLVPIFITLFDEKNEKINYFISYLPFSNLTFYNTMIILSLCFFFLILFKNLFSLFFLYKKAKVAF